MSEKKCKQCSGELAYEGDIVVCTICATVQEEFVLVSDHQDLNVVSVDRSTSKYNGKRTYFNRNSNSQEYCEKFENKLSIICNLLKLGESTKIQMRNNYYLASANWRKIKRIDRNFEYVCAALAYISTRKEDKGLCLMDIGIRLNLKYYTIGVLSMKIQSAGGIKVDILPEFGYMERGVQILRKLYFYTREECEAIKRLASELVKFSKVRGIAEGRTPTSTYCASLYLAQLHKLSTLSDYNAENDSASSYLDNYQITTLVQSPMKKRKLKTKTANSITMQPYLNDLNTEMNAPIHATRLRVRELESHLLARAQSNSMFSTFVNEKNIYQWIPLLLKDFFIMTSDINKKDNQDDDDNDDSQDEANLEREIENDNDEYDSDSDDNNNDIAVDDENLNNNKIKNVNNINVNVNNNNNNNNKRIKKDYQNKSFSSDTSGEDEVSSISFMNSSDFGGGDDDESSSYSGNQLGSKSGKKHFYKMIISQSSIPPPPSYILSLYKSIERKLCVIHAKFRLAYNGGYDKKKITQQDQRFFQQYKRYYPTQQSKKQDLEIEKLLINNIDESIILEGFKDFDEIELEKYLKENSDLFIKEDLNETDISDDNLILYLKSPDEKLFFQQIQENY
ncbi:hypothetical protein ACTFIR_006969 [Dictyostelium discoideum]